MAKAGPPSYQPMIERLCSSAMNSSGQPRSFAICIMREVVKALLAATQAVSAWLDSGLVHGLGNSLTLPGRSYGILFSAVILFFFGGSVCAEPPFSLGGSLFFIGDFPFKS